ncbi:Protein disulfide-isomerase [Sparganum proliferum]
MAGSLASALVLLLAGFVVAEVKKEDAPWCGHCQSLAPEYAKAAKSLLDDKSTVKLAKVDATVETKLAETYKIRGYPTLKFFAKGEEIEYNGGRTAESIVAWVKKKIGQAITEVATVEDFDELSQKSKFIVLVLSKDTSSKEYKTVGEVARAQDVPFVHCTDPKMADKHKLTSGTKVVIYRKFDEPMVEYDGQFVSAELTSFIRSHLIPLVVEFDEETAAQIFGSEIQWHIMVFMAKSQDHYEPYRKILREVALEFRNKAHAVIIDIDVENHERILDFFGISKKDCPTYRVVKLEDSVKKFKPETVDFSVEALRTFVDGVLTNVIKPYLQSAELPEDWDKDPVKVLVGKNFDEVAKDPSKTVFVMFYAPWCGHCKQLHPIWDQLGEHYKDHPEILIAKMDSTANELEDIKITGFPTLKLFPKNDDKIVDYAGDRTLEAFKKFLEAGGKDEEGKEEEEPTKPAKEEL